MALTIKDYDLREREALKHLSNRVIEAFQPVSFRATNYPRQVYDETELIRYVDTMHEDEAFKYSRAFCSYSLEEAKLISVVCDQVVKMTSEEFGSSIRPRMSPVAAIDLFRGIHSFGSLAEKEVLSVFEIGPGSGYLGAFLISIAYRYAAMDNAQAFYLWQSRLYEEFAPDEFTEMACGDALSMDAKKRVAHVP